jgi:hypothetical protein
VSHLALLRADLRKMQRTRSACSAARHYSVSCEEKKVGAAGAENGIDVYK